MPRKGSPVSGSTLTTSAPQSARMAPQLGPATQKPSSTTLMPSIGPAMRNPPIGDGRNLRAATVARMRERRRAWAAVVLVVGLTGMVPLALDRDSLPLSTFPMFSAAIDSTQSIATAVGVTADGATIRLV